MNTDPRRPDKIQRYVRAKNNANGEDLTPDYMNIMGQPAGATTANAESLLEAADPTKPPNPSEEPGSSVPTSAANVIPTSPQYGVAIISSEHTALTGHDPVTRISTDNTPTTTDSNSTSSSQPVNKTSEDSKDIHTTPSRNERFKVVKIASLEPFKRGRWKCMDYVDEAPPPNVVNANKVPQVATSAAPIAGGVYLQTQSLPQQQIQQMLLQGGQFFPNVQAQLIPQGQYFYPQVQQQPPHQQIPTQFINNQPYFPPGVVAANPAAFTIPQSYPNIQYVPIQAQGGAFVPTSQAMHNFQQSQSYAGQATGSQTNINPVGLVNGHAYPTEQPNQPAKSLIVNNSQPAPTQQYQQQSNNSYQPQQQQQQQYQPQTVAPVATVLAQQQQQQPPPPQQNFDAASNVYTNPQFTMSVNSLTVLEGSENAVAGAPSGVSGGGNVAAAAVDSKDSAEMSGAGVGESQEDASKSNPVVNAIDNKIEQAMDLVKSHLMYTVREEVEVLKEKIAELMERIQQLETENNYLRSQIPKNQTTVPPPTATNNNNNQPTYPQQQQQQQNIALVNPSPNAQVLPPQNNSMMGGGVSNAAPAPHQPAPSQNQTQATIPTSNLHQNEALATLH